MSFLEARGVVAGYGSRLVLRGVDIDVARGERVALVGPNGAGKTTLLRALAGLLRPRDGEVLLDGVSLGRLEPSERARRIAVVPQTFATPFAFTAKEIVGLGRTSYVSLLSGLRRDDRDAIDRAMRETDCGELGERLFAELSGGERQRVVLAMALAQDPELLLLDEPTAHLDLAHQLGFLALVDELARSRRIAVLATFHDMTFAARHVDRLVVLKEGSVVADGPGGQVLTAELLLRVFDVEASVFWHDGMPAIVPTVVTPPGARRSFD